MPKKRCTKDRRSGEDRRKTPYNLDYFLKGGKERRIGKTDRRLTSDRRRGWWSR